MTKQSMSALVYHLEERGYLKRKGDARNARPVLFILTPKGHTLRTKAQQFNYEFEKQWKQGLGVAQYEKFRGMLKALAEGTM
jgi:DNA-binding MarR family transcriptional regulator